LNSLPPEREPLQRCWSAGRQQQIRFLQQFLESSKITGVFEIEQNYALPRRKRAIPGRTKLRQRVPARRLDFRHARPKFAQECRCGWPWQIGSQCNHPDPCQRLPQFSSSLRHFFGSPQPLVSIKQSAASAFVASYFPAQRFYGGSGSFHLVEVYFLPDRAPIVGPATLPLDSILS
jgi:hypothetical protein